MKYGVSLPNFGVFGDARLLANLACDAEQAGWDGFFLWDHILFCELDKNPNVDPWIALAAIAMQTEKILIGTLITPLARRRPWKVARETVSLQNLSDGRLILGVGLGAPVEWDFKFFGEETDPKICAQKLDEGLDILQGLWTGEPFRYTGKHYQLEEMTFLPIPCKPIPIWVGGGWPNKAPFRRAARYDGLFPQPADFNARNLTPEDWRAILAYVRQHRTSSAPFDRLQYGITPANRAEYTKIIAPYAEVGVTWWIEDISPFQLGLGWMDFWKPWDVDKLRERILQGPPRIES